MRTTAIIAEYNPFHNGHSYQIKYAKELTNADFILVIMSGNFVQRGEPAFIHKYARTKIALENGADAVIELPVCYATSSAELFASGAVSILDQSGCIDSLCFGSETGTTKLFSFLAFCLKEESILYQTVLKHSLKQGNNFPAARAKAINALIRQQKGQEEILFSSEELSNFLSSPNNILGLEYYKALFSYKSTINPVVIQRMGAGYHSLKTDSKFCSATAVRTAYEAIAYQKDFSFYALSEFIQKFSAFLPVNVQNLLADSFLSSAPITLDDFSTLLQYSRLTKEEAKLKEISDLGIELSNRIKNSSPAACSFTQYANWLKTKQYTLTRIRRGLLHLILNITAQEIQTYKQERTGYIRLLGFKKCASPLLKNLQKNSSIPIITKIANANSILSENQRKLFAKDIFAAHIYGQVIAQKYGTLIKDEYHSSPIILS